MVIPLTDRQLEVLQLKARRFTNTEIAEQLVISITTVKWHVRQIYNKLGVNNRSEAVALAHQLGLLEQKQQQKTPPQRKFPSPVTPFIGREHELRYLTTLLTDPDTHLVTMIGPGGIGKTRLALQSARSLQHYFRDGICWVAFSAADKSELVFTTVVEYIAENIIESLGVILQGHEERSHLLKSYLREREILIVLDSFEEIVFGAAFIHELLSEASKCKFLVASRERLNLPGELLYPIAGLAQTQESAEDLSLNDAVKLFVQEGNRVSKIKIERTAELSVIQRICSRLEGMPLAIELAAEWTRLLSVEEIEQELDRGLDFLDTGSTSIRTVFDRSWVQLSDHQRASFSRLSVFQRGFSRDAARQVAGANLSTLSALFDKSLIQPIDESRYTIHDLLRQYAAEHLMARAERETTRDAHCAYFAGLVADQLPSIVSGEHSKILADLDNIRAAWQWAVKRRRLTDLHMMLFPLDWFYNLRTYYVEAMAAMRLVVDDLQTPNPEGLRGIVYGKALAHYGLEQSHAHGANQAEPATRQGLDILRRLGAREGLAWPLILSVFRGILGRNEQEGEQFCLESLEIFEEMNNPYGIAFSLSVLGNHYRKFGRYEEAQQRIESGLAVSRTIGDQEGTAYALRNLGHLKLHLGHLESARQNFNEEASLWEELSLVRTRNEAVRSLGEIALAAGNPEEAEQLFLESLAEFEQLGDEGNALINLLILGQMALQQGKLNQAPELLQDARPIMERRHEHQEQALWWQLSGRISLEQGDLEAALHCFNRALELSLPPGGLPLIETFLDFALYLQKQSDLETAAHLLGFVLSQPSLPAGLMQNRIDPLRTSLAAAMGDDRLAELQDEGAALDQQSFADHLREIK